MARLRLLGVVAVALVGCLTLATVARADGEAGLVIDDGQSTQTYCVAFEGDSITGDELLRRAGMTVSQFGGGARAVCSINGIGCGDASSFESCFCECGSGGPCTYWAYFIQRYGSSWQYSSIGFNLAQVRDGDLNAWKWGPGGPSSAPPPSGATFEGICGHPPQGGASPATPTPTSTATPTTAPPTPTPTQPGVPSPTPTGEATGSVTATATEPPASPASATSETASPQASPPRTSTAQVTPASVVVTLVPEDTDDETSGGGSPVGSWIAFGAIATLLVAGIGAGIAWRRRHGS